MTAINSKKIGIFHAQFILHSNHRTESSFVLTSRPTNFQSYLKRENNLLKPVRVSTLSL